MFIQAGLVQSGRLEEGDRPPTYVRVLDRGRGKLQLFSSFFGPISALPFRIPLPISLLFCGGTMYVDSFPSSFSSVILSPAVYLCDFYITPPIQVLRLARTAPEFLYLLPSPKSFVRPAHSFFTGCSCPTPPPPPPYLRQSACFVFAFWGSSSLCAYPLFDSVAI